MTDNRLLTCAKLVKGNKAVDVGTDHGYLAVYLISEGICDTVIACDVNEKPLNAARKTVKKSGYEEKIEVVLSDGLDNVKSDGVTDIIMAGMGGELIVKLLEKCSWIKDKGNSINLVLQPMSKSHILRKWLFDNNFSVEKELACEDGGFVYSVMQISFTGLKPEYLCDNRYLYGGRVEADDEYGAAYLQRQAQRLKTAGLGMLKSADKKADGEMLLQSSEILLRGI